MKKILFLTPALLFCFFILVPWASADTEVSGEIRNSTTWTEANSPYVLIRTVEIPKTVTLTIEPGVTVSMPGAFDMFSVKGKIIASGTAAEKIIFDGGGNSTFFNAINSTNLTLVDLNYCEIKNGRALWQNGFGSFNLRNSLVENLNEASNIRNPINDIYIEYNEFRNASGFSVNQGNGNHIYIRHNLFNGKNSGLSTLENYYIQSVASFDTSAIVLENNSFLDITGVAVALAQGEAQARLSATNNYWGTVDATAIAAMIYDKNDNSTCAGYIEYLPILSEPAAGTPDIARTAAPTIDTVTSPTGISSQTISGEKAAGVSIWLNGAEIVAADDNTTWSYGLELNLGENNISVTAKDQNGSESLATAAAIIRSETICTNWTYSDWGACENGQQARAIITSLPTGCAGGSAVLTQNCTVEIPVNIVAEEKALVKTVNTALAKRLSGRILLQVERSGEAWYIFPTDKKKYYLGRPADAFNVMRKLGLGATNEFISSRTIFPSSVLGRILLDVEKNGEAYYINPVDKKAYYLGRPQDAFRIMRELGLGALNSDLRQIAVGEIK